MALGGAAAAALLKSTTILDQLLEEINFQRTKEMRQLLKDDGGFVVLQGTTYWTDLFVRHFLFQEERAIDCDDLLFFVRKRHVKGSSRYLPKYETGVDVFRKDSKKLPIGDPEIDWEETVYLNLIVHQFEYTLTLAVCTRTSPKELQVLRRHSQQVYASPSRRKMDTKGEGEEMTYPHICFMVDNFDEVFCDMCVRAGEMVCVELVARGRGGGAQAVIFLGSIRYDALTTVYDSRQTSLSTKVAQRMSFGLLGGGGGGGGMGRLEFVRLRGPAGKGHAEMCVARPRGSGVDTPCSEPGLDCPWDDDWDQDPDDVFLYRNQRRLSDPSANVANFSRGGWRTRDKDGKSRSEDGGLDSLVPGITEIEAGDVRDGGAASSARAPTGDGGGGAGAGASMGAVCGRARGAGSAGCLATVTPRRARRIPPPSAAPPPLRPLPAATARRAARAPVASPDECCECEVATEASEADSGVRPAGPEVPAPADGTGAPMARGREELPCARQYAGDGGGGGGGCRAYCTWPRGGGAGALLYRGAPLPPRRTAPDGTEIVYWCDRPKNKHTHNELDDGAYHPLWAMRGFSQTFHLWKEGKRQSSAPLTAYLTYVTLPWWSIAKDILDHREEPILTF